MNTASQERLEWIEKQKWLSEDDKRTLIALFEAGKVFEALWTIRRHPNYVNKIVKVEEEA